MCLLCDDEKAYLRNIEKLTRRSIRVLPTLTGLAGAGVPP